MNSSNYELAEQGSGVGVGRPNPEPYWLKGGWLGSGKYALGGG